MTEPVPTEGRGPDPDQRVLAPRPGWAWSPSFPDGGCRPDHRRGPGARRPSRCPVGPVDAGPPNHARAFECVVRGYLSGSAWQEYRRTGTLAGEPLPGGMVESQRFPRPVFSPATKAETGHDENVTVDAMRRALGAERTAELEARSLGLYEAGRRSRRAAGHHHRRYQIRVRRRCVGNAPPDR